MQNLASVTSIKIEFTTWVTLFQKRVYLWTLTILKLLRISLTPKNVTEVRYFMGIAGYYRRFIEGFSKVAHAITSLQRKGIKFKWTSKCEEIFQQLKCLLTSAPVLKVADPKKYFVVCTDACGQGLGGFLMQDNHVA